MTDSGHGVAAQALASPLPPMTTLVV